MKKYILSIFLSLSGYATFAQDSTSYRREIAVDILPILPQTNSYSSNNTGSYGLFFRKHGKHIWRYQASISFKDLRRESSPLGFSGYTNLGKIESQGIGFGALIGLENRIKTADRFYFYQAVDIGLSYGYNYSKSNISYSNDTAVAYSNFLEERINQFSPRVIATLGFGMKISKRAALSIESNIQCAFTHENQKTEQIRTYYLNNNSNSHSKVNQVENYINVNIYRIGALYFSYYF